VDLREQRYGEIQIVPSYFCLCSNEVQEKYEVSSSNRTFFVIRKRPLPAENPLHFTADSFISHIHPSFHLFLPFIPVTPLYNVSTKSRRCFEKLWRANKLS
jgi:hypothetical protein